MDTKRKFRYVTTPLALAGLMGVAVMAPGCSEDNPLCCSESDFQVGGTIAIEGEAGVAVQAVADIGGIASGMLDDLTTACRSMAEDLDVPAADRAAAEANADKRDRMNAYCNLAVSAIADFKANLNATLTVNFAPPKCEASVSAAVDCEARCDVNASCDIQATPPTCEGGTLTVSCEGSCTAEGNASVMCEGSCDAACEGSCTAEAGGVECAGKCDGTCSAGGMGGGTGIQADGTCEGMCEGTCEVVAPGITCNGSCSGSCMGACTASANASVTCDGSCDGNFEPLKCEGGELKGGCEVDADCSASCDASVSAKAQCTPPELEISFSAGFDADVGGKLKAALDNSFGLIVALGARLEAVGALTASFEGAINADVLGEIKPACIPTVIVAAGNAVADIGVSASASVMVIGEVAP